MDTKDYIIVGLSVALTLTLVAVIIVLVSGKAQMEEPRFYKDEIMDNVIAAIGRGEVVAPNVYGINAEVRRRQEESAKLKLSDEVVTDMAADYLEL